jgi:hypothetical protein
MDCFTLPTLDVGSHDLATRQTGLRLHLDRQFFTMALPDRSPQLDQCIRALRLSGRHPDRLTVYAILHPPHLAALENKERD